MKVVSKKTIAQYESEDDMLELIEITFSNSKVVYHVWFNGKIVRNISRKRLIEDNLSYFISKYNLIKKQSL